MNAELIAYKEVVADKIELTELANKLFMYYDTQQWPRMLDEVFTQTILFDMSSAGGSAPSMLAANAVCEIWRQGFC